MNIFLKLKHWQLLLVWILASIQLQVFKATDFWYISFAVYVALIFGWIYSIGKVLNEKKSDVTKRLNSWSIVYLIAMTPFAIHFHYMMVDSYQEMNILLLIAGGIIGSISFLKVVLISAKSIKEKEKNGALTFGSYALEFFLILYMILGIWILQPKLNKIVDNE